MSTVAASDSQVIAMLCAPIAVGDVKPLTLGEWARLAELLHASELKRPSALVGMSPSEVADALPLAPPLAVRIADLLERGGMLTFELDRLRSRGVWMITRADDSYPERLRKRLRSKTPPVLFGVGSKELLSGGGVAIVGSRDAPPAALEFTESLARTLAQEGTTVFSGAARGVDRTAMTSATEAGGNVVGVLADSLLRPPQQADTRRLIEEGLLSLVTPFSPDVRFTAGNAMARNKLIYCLADSGVVAATAAESGGTWNGATETLRQRWVPVWTWADPEAPTGNRALLARGARELLGEQISVADLAAYLSAARATDVAPTELPSTQIADVFNAVWPILERFLGQPRSEGDIVEQLDLERSQVRAWLRRAVDEGRLVKREKPVRYVLADALRDQPTLFDVA